MRPRIVNLPSVRLSHPEDAKDFEKTPVEDPIPPAKEAWREGIGARVRLMESFRKAQEDEE